MARSYSAGESRTSASPIGRANALAEKATKNWGSWMGESDSLFAMAKANKDFLNAFESTTSTLANRESVNKVANSVREDLLKQIEGANELIRRASPLDDQESVAGYNEAKDLLKHEVMFLDVLKDFPDAFTTNETGFNPVSTEIPTSTVGKSVVQPWAHWSNTMQRERNEQMISSLRTAAERSKSPVAARMLSALNDLEDKMATVYERARVCTENYNFARDGMRDALTTDRFAEAEAMKSTRNFLRSVSDDFKLSNKEIIDWHKQMDRVADRIAKLKD